MSLYIFALGIKAANGLVKSTINTANAFSDEGTEVSIINILGKNGGFDFLDPAFKLNENVNRYSLDAMSETYGDSLKNESFHTEMQQFLKAEFHQGHKKVLESLNEQLTENDLIIFSHPLAMILFAKANPTTKAKTVIQVHGNYIEEVDNMELLRGYVDYVDYIQTVSLYMRNDLIQFLNVPAEKVICIYNITRPISLNKKLTPYLKRISIVGSIQERKNQLDAVKMLELIQDRNVILQIYGKPLKKEYMERIEFYIKSNNLKDRVVFYGLSSEEDIYSNSDVIVMTSEHEGYPYIFFESAIYGIPIVSYDFKYGAKEFTCDNQNGCLVPMFDYQKMAEVVNTLLTNEEEYKQVAQFNLENFNKKYNEKSILADYHKLFKNINRKLVLNEKEINQVISIDNLKSTSSIVEVYEPWSGKNKDVEAFNVSFDINVDVSSACFFYTFHKSNFAINLVEATRSSDLLSRFMPCGTHVSLKIPKVNRLSLDMPMSKFDIYMQYNNQTYYVAAIQKAEACQPKSSDKYPMLTGYSRLNFEWRDKMFIKDIPHILRIDGFFIGYPDFDAIKSIKDECNEELGFSTRTLKFYGKDLLVFKLASGLYKKLHILMNSGKSFILDFSQYSYKSVFDKLLELEKRYNLYDVKVANSYIWELIRVPVFEHILEATGVLDKHFSKPSTISNVYFGDYSIENLPKKNILLFEFPRKKSVDYKTLAFKQEFKSECNILEYPQKDGYIDAYNDENVYPIKDFLDYCDDNNIEISYSSEDKSIIRWFKRIFIEAFGLDIEFSQFIHARLIKFTREFNYFNKFFSTSSYKEVVIPSAYWSAGIIAAARKNNIITSDIQYALISPYHPSFAFHTNARAYGTDRVYLWSKYWIIKETTYNKSFVLESNYFKEKIKQLNLNTNLESEFDVVFISQGRIGKRIFDFALDFAKSNPRLTLAFCPHPDELVEKYPRFQEVSKYTNLVLNTKYDSLVIINKSKSVVGVYSTALIEALALGKRVYSFTISGHEVMKREVEKGYIEYVSNAKDLLEKIESASENNKNLAKELFNIEEF